MDNEESTDEEQKETSPTTSEAGDKIKEEKPASEKLSNSIGSKSSETPTSKSSRNNSESEKESSRNNSESEKESSRNDSESEKESSENNSESEKESTEDNSELDKEIEQDEEQKENIPKKPRKNPLDDLNDDDLEKLVYDLQAEVLHLKTENGLFERYLLLNEPQLLEGMTAAIDNAMRMFGTESVRRATLAETHSLKSLGSNTIKVESFGATNSISDKDKGPRVNLTQKTEMVLREMEELNTNLIRFRKQDHKKKCYLKAELEEFDNEINELTNCLELFEQAVVIEGVDPLTQRIPAEKFIRFMQEWLKSSSAIVQKYRLKQSTLASHLRKLREILKQKKELGESLHVVDFEKLQIENNHFVKEIDLKTLQLIDLKRINGGANLILTNQKKFLNKQIIEMQQIEKDMENTKYKIENLEREAEEAEEQLDKVRAHYENIQEMIEEYQVPDVMEYVKVKGKLYELKKNIKIWSRRSHLQKVALNSSIREMKNITGSRKVLDWWFEKNNQHSEAESDSNVESSEGNDTEEDGSFTIWEDNGNVEEDDGNEEDEEEDDLKLDLGSLE